MPPTYPANNVGDAPQSLSAFHSARGICHCPSSESVAALNFNIAICIVVVVPCGQLALPVVTYTSPLVVSTAGEDQTPLPVQFDGAV